MSKRRQRPCRLACLLAIALLSACGGGGGGGPTTAPAASAPPAAAPPPVPPPVSDPPNATPPTTVTATFTVTLHGIDVSRPSNGETVLFSIASVWNENLEFAE